MKEERKAVHKRMLFPLNKKSDSANRDEGLVKKIHLHYAGKLLSAAGIYIYKNA